MKQIDVTPSSGNVFADLGLPDAEELYAKSFLSIEIARTIRRRRLTPLEAARVLNATEQAIAEIVQGTLAAYSIEKLTEIRDTLAITLPPSRPDSSI